MGASSIRPSIASSTSSGSFAPSGPMSLIPLSGAGLWLALITQPKPNPAFLTANETVGVGTTPRTVTSTPTEQNPEANAAPSIGPLFRVSRPITTVGFPIDRPAAWPSLNANSGVKASLATPRIPSVPKCFRLTAFSPLLPVRVGGSCRPCGIQVRPLPSPYPLALPQLRRCRSARGFQGRTVCRWIRCALHAVG